MHEHQNLTYLLKLSSRSSSSSQLKTNKPLFCSAGVVSSRTKRIWKDCIVAVIISKRLNAARRGIPSESCSCQADELRN